MPKLNVRVSQKVLDDIEKLIEDGDYSDISEFVRTAVREKLDPEYGKARLKRLLGSLLREDPDFLKELVEAVRFYQKL